MPTNPKYTEALRGLAREITTLATCCNGITKAEKAVAQALSARLLPVLEAADATIEFYGAHGGPMGDLRTALDNFAGGKL